MHSNSPALLWLLPWRPGIAVLLLHCHFCQHKGPGWHSCCKLQLQPTKPNYVWTDITEDLACSFSFDMLTSIVILSGTRYPNHFTLNSSSMWWNYDTFFFCSHLWVEEDYVFTRKGSHSHHVLIKFILHVNPWVPPWLAPSRLNLLHIKSVTHLNPIPVLVGLIL